MGDSDQIETGYTAPLNFLVKPVTDGFGATQCYVCQPVPKLSERYNNGNSKYTVIGILLVTVALCHLTVWSWPPSISQDLVGRYAFYFQYDKP